MAAKNAPKPRPNKNSDGQNKRPIPTMTHSISIEPGKPTPPPEPPPPPGAPPPGHTNPMTHPMHPAMQSALGTGPQQPQSPQPGTAPMGPTGKPADQRQVRENIQFKDMNPAEQSQVAQQQGINPYAPLQMVQQETEGALQQGQSSGPVPNMLAGPYVPPGVESFPDDMAHLTQLMSQGYAPGATHQEHGYAQNANAMARAKIQQAMANAQNGVGEQVAQPTAPPPQVAPGGPPPGVSLSPGIPTMQSSMGTPPAGLPSPQEAAGGPPVGPVPGNMGGPPPVQPGAPGGIPPELIAALLAKAKQKRPVR